MNYYVVLLLFFLTTLKYHSNKFLELKPKDEVTLLSKLNFFPHAFLLVPIFDPNTRLRSFFHPLNIVELSQKKKKMCVQEANLGKVAKSCTAQIKGSIFKKINQNYFAHICPECIFRVKLYVFVQFFTSLVPSLDVKISLITL